MDKKKKIMVSIRLEPKIIAFVDDIAQKGNITRSKVIHNLIDIGHTELKTQKNIGLVKLNLMVRQFKKSLKPVLAEAEKQIAVEDEPKKGSVSVRMDNDLIQRIDLLSEQIGLTRKGFIEYVLEFEIREMKLLLKIPGFLSTSVFLRDIEEAIKKNWKNRLENTKQVLEDKTLKLEDNNSEKDSE
ncbi:hypothetical protein [uncultured Desulfobacter sp.]|uniref:hypothetical protein n=1 Tax=uncultured Desulfobacter sp. TaxID=240139 RepID=UPI002AA8DCFD|nr:hypothetical protein [uncultured Desulfobacter sp.]